MDPVVILGSETVSVGPGQEQRVPVRIRNQGRRVESYRVDLVGAPAQFAQVVPAVVSVLPGREAEVDVIFRPPGGAATPSGTLPFAIRATSEVEASSSAVAEGRLELAGVAGLQAWAPETTRSGRWSTRYYVEFANQGNAAARLALTAHDPTSVTKLELTPDVIDLVPGGRATAELKAKTREPFLRGSPANRSVQVTCQTFPFGTERPVPGGVPPQGDPNHRTFQLTFQQKPVLPKFAFPLIVLLVVGLLALAVVTLRRGEQPTLDLTGPMPPTGFAVTSGGPSSILLAWDAVPNAEGYEVRRTSSAGTPDEEVLAEGLPPEQRTFTVDQDLLADTEYCFTVRALGPEEGVSTLVEPSCARTSPATTLPAPTGVNVVAEADDQYRVTWEFPTDVADVEFEIIADQVVVQRAVASGAIVELVPGVEARAVSVAVRAVLGGETSPPSAPPNLVDVPALPVETVVTSTESTPPVEVVPPPPPADGGATSTSAPAPTTTVPSPGALSELKNLEQTWVAMLGPAPATAAGGEALELRKERLAELFAVPTSEMAVFTNRDTLARRPDGSPTILEGAAAAERFVYVERPDAIQAQEICDRSDGCSVVSLEGAARASEGTSVLVLESLSAQSPIVDVDARLDELRAEFATRSVHAFNAIEYEEFGSARPIIFVRGFASEGAARDFCTANGPLESCDVRLLGAD